jgi:DsbC/DsbD-like thiol-disulfide interchange protein
MLLARADPADYMNKMNAPMFRFRLWNSARRSVGAIAVIVSAAMPMQAAQAADASGWDGGLRAAVRLIAGTPRGEAGATIHRAGIDFRLSRGWKTYWRYPGDSGIPPRFDFTGSENVKAIAVRWPAPHRLEDESGTSIGYKQDFVLPLEIWPQDAAKPVSLRLRIDYGICEKICIPAEGKADLVLTGASSTHANRLAQFEARVPRPARLGGDGPLAIRTAMRQDDAPLGRMVLDVAAPAGAKLELFAEGPSADWALPLPAPIAGAPEGLQRFAFKLDGLPPGAKPDGATLTITAVTADQAIEVPVPVK